MTTSDVLYAVQSYVISLLSYLTSEEYILPMPAGVVMVPQAAVMAIINRRLISSTAVILLEIYPYRPGPISGGYGVHHPPPIFSILCFLIPQHLAEHICLMLPEVVLAHSAPDPLMPDLQQT